MVATYNIAKMKENLEKAQSCALRQIQNQFKTFLSELKNSYLSSDTPDINSKVVFYNIKDHSSIKNIYRSEGFYIICTDHEGKDAEKVCSFKLKKQKQTAVYRGECSSVQRRIESHLFNRKYKEGYEKRKKDKEKEDAKFSESYYGACIKINPLVNGINIDAKPYCKSKWSVIVLKMPRSSSLIRKQAELAFDSLFGKPLASR